MRAALHDGDASHLLHVASTLLEVVDPRRVPYRSVTPDPGPIREELLTSFLEVDTAETTALLTAWAALAGDDLLRRRIRDELARRTHPMPGWLAGIERAVGVPRTVEIVHVLGDGDNVMICTRLVDGQELTAVVYIDHNLGTQVKDAFVVPASVEQVAEKLLAAAADPDVAVRELAPADARARIVAAIERGAMTVPPCETDTWPACRTLVEWMAGMLPAGGVGYTRPAWGKRALAELAARFLASPYGAGLGRAHRDHLDTILWLGSEYGRGDPMRWSPVAVEILLLDYVPRKVYDSPGRLATLPDVLRAFVRFCHHERGLRPALTEQTLAAVDAYEPEYRRLINGPRIPGLFGGLPPGADAAAFAQFAQAGFSGSMLEMLERAVGGEAALQGLDAEPLPDEPFAWAAIPEDVHDRVHEVLMLIDACCADLLDVEYRTACRRLLSDVASGDPAIFRRRSRADTAAAAVCWIIGRANSLFGPGPGQTMHAKDLIAHLSPGSTGVSQRAAPFLRAIGAGPPSVYEMSLGSPRYLVSARRERILRDREHYLALGRKAAIASDG